uniref:Uncharacterized protein n=1 Tax=Arundo donax TaxID=35708 RepID=A0A0A9E582_ARUDO
MQLFLKMVDRLIIGLLSLSSSAWYLDVLPLLDTGISFSSFRSVGDDEVLSCTSSSRVD